MGTNKFLLEQLLAGADRRVCDQDYLLLEGEEVLQRGEGVLNVVSSVPQHPIAVEQPVIVLLGKLREVGVGEDLVVGGLLDHGRERERQSSRVL